VPQRVNSKGEVGSAPFVTPAAILLGLYWCVQGIDVTAPQLERILLLIAGAALLGVTLVGRQSALLACCYAVLIATSERAGREVITGGSDVLRATTEAIDVLLAGVNPYAHVMQSTTPPGSPFVYPPGEFLFYLPFRVVFGDITRVDTWTGVLIVVLLLAAGVRAGFDAVALPAMLYATWGAAAFHAIDGSNDVSASFVLVLALVLLAFASPTRAGAWTLIASAIAFGWAMAFKQFAFLVLPPVLRHLAVADFSWRRYALIALGTGALITLPFLVLDPGAFVSQQLALFTFHQETWGANLLAVIARFTDPTDLLPVFAVAQLVLTAAVIVIALRWHIPTLGTAALAGSAAILVPLLLARWTTQPYYVYVGAVAACGLALVNSRLRSSVTQTVSRVGTA
jgi:hypothetical protein